MTPGVRLTMTTPIRSIQLLEDEPRALRIALDKSAAELEQTRRQLMQACTAMSKAATELEAYRTTLFSSNREHIVRLSVEIAARIVAKEVAEGNYAIEQIVLDALESAPPGRPMTIRLHPDDVKAFETAAADLHLTLPPNTDIAADPTVKPAECVIDTEQGMVESLIDDHLRQIGEALLGLEQPL